MSEVCSRCWRAHRSQALVRGRASEPQQRSVATATEFHGLRYGMGYARTTGRKDGSGADGRALEFSIAACHVLCREIHTEERAVLPILMDPMSQSRLSSTRIPRELFISLTTRPAFTILSTIRNTMRIDCSWDTKLSHPSSVRLLLRVKFFPLISVFQCPGSPKTLRS